MTPNGLPFSLRDTVASSGTTSSNVLIVVPKTPMVVGDARLGALRAARGVNAVERRLIGEARRREARVMVLRAVNDAGERVWQFDAAIGLDALVEAGYVMSRALLPLHRRLVAVGVMLFIHTEWDLRDSTAMREGVRRLVEERRVADDACREIDVWLLSHMLLHLGLGLDHVLNSLLPDHLAVVERRIPRVQQMLAELPASAID